jgi:hypothetical protein
MFQPKHFDTRARHLGQSYTNTHGHEKRTKIQRRNTHLGKQHRTDKESRNIQSHQQEIIQRSTTVRNQSTAVILYKTSRPPSFYTRRADRLPLPPLTEYCRAYTNIMTNNIATTTAITFSFAVLNRTVWTAKKQALPGNAGGNRQEEVLDSGQCTLCGQTEDTAHILVNCNNYSYRAWERTSAIITAACRNLDLENGRVNLTFSNIMYHTNILSLPQPYKKQ